MKYRNIDYYKEFNCIADKCLCTCCSGWAIEIDEDSLKRFKRLSIDTVDYKEAVFKHKKCSLDCANLREDGLCKLILTHGEDILCDTCRLFPRHTEEFLGVREQSLSISCPEVARIILSKSEYTTYSYSNDDVEDLEEYDDYEQEIFSRLEPLRDEMIDVLHNDNLPVIDRLNTILKKASDFQTLIDGELGMESDSMNIDICDDTMKLFSIMEEWEYTSDTFPDMLAESKEVLENKSLVEWDITEAIGAMRIIHITEYFINAYFCGSCYDEYYYGQAALAVAVAYHISMLSLAHKLIHGTVEAEDIIRITYLYARELEHSIPNILLTEQWLDTNRL